ncbi:hypothetical protein [Clostridium sp. ZBS13]|uniref:hypothetical protein n=1 Tax=Clostridium sp. ZBS13 TaxID=2949971 RepID=UPI00207AAB9B|nr:hypothetical protein [Clostridium sp. ZBS13]
MGKFIFVFLFSPKAISITIVTFLLFFIIISIQSSTIIYKYSLIELFKANSRTLATITILTATTLTAVGTAVALQMDFNKNITKTIPFGIVTTSTNENYINDIKNIINNYDKNKLLYQESIDTIMVNGSTRASYSNS